MNLNNFDFPDFFKHILLSRQLDDNQKLKKFLFPEYKDLYNPFLMKNMLNSVEIIFEHIYSQKKILIFGDKDVDGITSIIILYNTIKGLGGIVQYKIPDPEDNYGVPENIDEYCIDNNIELFITVDCGISANKIIERLKVSSIEVIITDHHTPDFELPATKYILNPKQKDCIYPDKMLAGCGVSFKLSSAIMLYSILDKKKLLDFNFEELTYKYILFLEKNLPIAAIGTIADVVPLEKENRIISRLGYEILKNKKIEWFEILKEYLNIEKIDGDTIGFFIVPLLNSSRRMQKLSYSLKFFLTKKFSEKRKFCGKLIELNKQRKIKTEKFFNKVLPDAEKKLNNNVIVLSYKNVEHGVTGLVANRICEKLNKPVFIFLIDENGIAGGAGRSPESINIYEKIYKLKELFIKFGGHKSAVGLSMPESSLQNFEIEINNMYFEKRDSDECLEQQVFSINLKEINFQVFQYLELLYPFGRLNNKPIFFIKELLVRQAYTMGKNHEHLNAYFNSNIPFRGVGWGLGSFCEKFNTDQLKHIIGELNENYYNNKKSIQLKIIDFSF